MENFREQMYAACRQMGMEIVPMDTGARVMAVVYICGDNEGVTHSPRLKAELEHLQKLYKIEGGETVEPIFHKLIKRYVSECEDYMNKNNDYCQWAKELFLSRYNIKL